MLTIRMTYAATHAHTSPTCTSDEARSAIAATVVEPVTVIPPANPSIPSLDRTD